MLEYYDINEVQFTGIINDNVLLCPELKFVFPAVPKEIPPLEIANRCRKY